MEVEIGRMVILLEEDTAVQVVLQNSWEDWKESLMVLRL